LYAFQFTESREANHFVGGPSFFRYWLSWILGRIELFSPYRDDF